MWEPSEGLFSICYEFTCCGRELIGPGVYITAVFLSCIHFKSRSSGQTLSKKAMFPASGLAVILPWTCAVKGPGHGELEIWIAAHVCACFNPICLCTPIPLFLTILFKFLICGLPGEFLPSSSWNPTPDPNPSPRTHQDVVNVKCNQISSAKLKHLYQMRAKCLFQGEGRWVLIILSVKAIG